MDHRKEQMTMSCLPRIPSGTRFRRWTAQWVSSQTRGRVSKPLHSISKYLCSEAPRRDRPAVGLACLKVNIVRPLKGRLKLRVA